MNWKITIAVGAIILFTGTINAQGTPDGVTPANENACDVLADKTPGLYGLCVAFCEAQDWELYDSDDPLAATNTTPGRMIFENYNKKMTPDDPEMPCLVPPPECPCFNVEEAQALFFWDRYDQFDCIVEYSADWLFAAVASKDESQNPPWRYRAAAAGGILPDGTPAAVCRYWNLDIGQQVRFFKLEDLPDQWDSFLNCTEILADLIENDSSGDCSVINP